MYIYINIDIWVYKYKDVNTSKYNIFFKGSIYIYVYLRKYWYMDI